MITHTLIRAGKRLHGEHKKAHSPRSQQISSHAGTWKGFPLVALNVCNPRRSPGWIPNKNFWPEYQHGSAPTDRKLRLGSRLRTLGELVLQVRARLGKSCAMSCCRPVTMVTTRLGPWWLYRTQHLVLVRTWTRHCQVLFYRDLHVEVHAIASKRLTEWRSLDHFQHAGVHTDQPKQTTFLPLLKLAALVLERQV
jgi:hypothetical protein